MSHRDSSDRLRRRIAVDAARLMADSGQRNFNAARGKAAARYGIDDERDLPSNAQIDEALREHQALFDDGHPALLVELRRAAAEAMRFFAAYEPRLVGAVLDGSADGHSAICLHLFCDGATEVIVFLMDHGIRFVEASRRLRYGGTDQRDYPVLKFAAGGHAIDLTLFDRDELRQAPLDRVSHRPMKRASLATVQALLDDMNPA